jgi:hypothetical protein
VGAANLAAKRATGAVDREEGVGRRRSVRVWGRPHGRNPRCWSGEGAWDFYFYFCIRSLLEAADSSLSTFTAAAVVFLLAWG